MGLVLAGLVDVEDARFDRVGAFGPWLHYDFHVFGLERVQPFPLQVDVAVLKRIHLRYFSYLKAFGYYLVDFDQQGRGLSSVHHLDGQPDILADPRLLHPKNQVCLYVRVLKAFKPHRLFMGWNWCGERGC